MYLCLDKGYNYPEIEQEVVKRGYVPHIRQRGEGKKNQLRKEDIIIQQEDGYIMFIKYYVR